MNKEKLKKNAFWIGIGAAFALIAAFFFLYVWGAMGARDRTRKELQTSLGQLKEIRDNGGEVPSERQIQIYRERVAQLAGELDDAQAGCKPWYKAYDDVLEQWFSELHVDPSGAPPIEGDFRAQYNARKEKLEAELQGDKITLGTPVAASATPLFGAAQPAASDPLNWEKEGNIKEIQKHFWIRERIKNILRELQRATQGTGVVALEDVRFSPAMNPSAPHEYAGWPVPAGGSPLREYDLPDGYGAVITCGIRAQIQHPHAAKYLQLLLERDAYPPRMLVKLRGVRISLIEPFPDEEPRTVSYKRGEDADAKKRDELAKAEQEVNQPKPVRVYVTLEVFDFDGPKLAAPFK